MARPAIWKKKRRISACKDNGTAYTPAPKPQGEKTRFLTVTDQEHINPVAAQPGN